MTMPHSIACQAPRRSASGHVTALPKLLAALYIRLQPSHHHGHGRRQITLSRDPEHRESLLPTPTSNPTGNARVPNPHRPSMLHRRT